MRRTWANVDKNAKAFGWTGNSPAQPKAVSIPAPKAPVESTPRPRQTYQDIGTVPDDGDENAPKIVLRNVTRPK